MVSLFANNHFLQKVWVSLEIKYQTMGINLHFIACPGLVFHGYILYGYIWHNSFGCRTLR